MLLAGALRTHRLGGPSYWIDEFFSLEASNGYRYGETFPLPGVVLSPAPRATQIEGARPLDGIVAALRLDNHAPVYFFLLRAWREAFGDGEAATRSLSVAASLATLLLLFDAIRTLHGSGSALLGTALLATAGMQVRFAQEARPYALAAAFVVAAAAALARLERHGPDRRRALAFGAAALFAMLTHYYAAGALLGLALHAATALSGRARRQALIALVLAGIAYAALWGPVLIEQRLHVLRNNAWILEKTPDHALRTLERVESMPLQFLLATSFTLEPGVRWAALGYAIALLLAWRRPSLRLWLLWALGAIGFVAAVDLGFDTGQLGWTRYVFPAAPAVLALIAAIEVPALGRRAAHAPAAAALLIALLALPGAYLSVKPGWREYARVLDQAAREGELVAVTIDDRELLQALLHYAWEPKRAFMVLSRRPSARELATLRARGEFWFLAMREQPDPTTLMPDVQVEERVEYSRSMPLLWRLRFDSRARLSAW